MNSFVMKTPIGFLKITEENELITEIKYIEDCILMEQKSTPILDMAVKQLTEYFEGERTEFCLPLDIKGTNFTKTVLNKLANVTYGSTITYGELAKLAGNSKAARAVGTVMRKNSFIIVLPCHRVLPKNNSLGNYSAGGAQNKEWLLTFEKQNINPFTLLNIVNML